MTSVWDNFCFITKIIRQFLLLTYYYYFFLDIYCRVTNCSPHLNRNRKWAQQAQYNKFVREWVKELG